MTEYNGRLTNHEKREGKVVYHYPSDWTSFEILEAVAERLWKLEEKFDELLNNQTK